MSALFTVSGLSLSFGETQLFDAVDFTIEPNQHTALHGRSGAGKSTLLKILSGLQPFDAGTVSYNGSDIHDYDYQQLRREVAYVTQTPQLFDRTVRENLAFPYMIRDTDVDEARLTELMKAVNLDYIDWDTDIDSLSGGERQRVGLVRSLAISPKVLLLDEITSALDQHNQEAVESLLRRFADEHDATLIWIAHHQTHIVDPKQTITINDDHTVSSEKGDAE